MGSTENASPSLSAEHLTLFFTRGLSLQTWDGIGILEREVAIYHALRPYLGDVSFLTYGDAGDLSYADRLPGIRILCNRWNLPLRLYEGLLPILHASSLRQATLLKTNQTNGGLVALRVKRMYRNRLIARCGFMWSEFAARQAGVTSRVARKAKRHEERIFLSADAVVVTTEEMKGYVIYRYALRPQRVTIIPNYVDTELFKPRPRMRQMRTVYFVGRLAEQKNLFALLEALKSLDLELVVIGNGPLRESLVAKAHNDGIQVYFLGNVPHRALPDHLNRAEMLILPSLYEGHPKALLEAMACGLPVIGTNAPGIRELICHGETGWLCGTDPASIRAAIQELLARPALQAEMGRNARQFVVENFSLDRVAEMELKVLASVACKKKERE